MKYRNKCTSRLVTFLLSIGYFFVYSANAANYPQPILFSHYAHSKITFKLSSESLENLEEELPSDVLDSLIVLKKQKFENKQEFLSAVEKQIGQEQTNLFKIPIVQAAQNNGVACITCHRFYKTQKNSGYPNTFICMDCHSNTITDSAEEEKLRQFEAKGQPVIWTRTTKMPSHVRYSHQRHVIEAKIECKTCHGDFTQLREPPSEPAIDLSMDFCIDCHKINHFEIGRQSLKQLKKTDLETEFLKKLKTIQNLKFRSEEAFFNQLDKLFSKALGQEKKELIFKHTDPSESLSTDCIACHR
jgi:hypothetical protein